MICSRDWFGEFTVVWKPKTARTRLLSLGMQGDEVRWLRRSLNALAGGPSDPEHAMSTMRNWRSPCRTSSANIGSMSTASRACRPKSCSTPHWPIPSSPLLLPNALRGG